MPVCNYCTLNIYKSNFNNYKYHSHFP